MAERIRPTAIRAERSLEVIKALPCVLNIPVFFTLRVTNDFYLNLQISPSWTMAHPIPSHAHMGSR